MKETAKGLYQCEECRLIYEDPSWAEKCEKWCKVYKSCNLEITKHATEDSKNDI